MVSYSYIQSNEWECSHSKRKTNSGSNMSLHVDDSVYEIVVLISKYLIIHALIN